MQAKQPDRAVRAHDVHRPAIGVALGLSTLLLACSSPGTLGKDAALLDGSDSATAADWGTDFGAVDLAERDTTAVPEAPAAEHGPVDSRANQDDGYIADSAMASEVDIDSASGLDVRPAMDAQDHASPDVAPFTDASSRLLPPAFAPLPGATFAIAAANTAPDASTQGVLPCRPSDGTAHYNLVFSADATSVRIVRTDPVQEPVVNGVLSTSSEARLTYDLTNLFAGGALVIDRVDGNFVAELVIFGSGVPVVSCIESAMTKA